jgi:hypothetical protein
MHFRVMTGTSLMLASLLGNLARQPSRYQIKDTTLIRATFYSSVPNSPNGRAYAVYLLMKCFVFVEDWKLH